MTVSEVIILLVAGVLAGALNSVAGGGSFISFPALASVGIPLINANTTNTLALWPGVVASVGAYRKELMEKVKYELTKFGLKETLAITNCVRG